MYGTIVDIQREGAYDQVLSDQRVPPYDIRTGWRLTVNGNQINRHDVRRFMKLAMLSLVGVLGRTPRRGPPSHGCSWQGT
jgi:hypothetical protein